MIQDNKYSPTIINSTIEIQRGVLGHYQVCGYADRITYLKKNPDFDVPDSDNARWSVCLISKALLWHDNYGGFYYGFDMNDD